MVPEPEAAVGEVASGGDVGGGLLGEDEGGGFLGGDGLGIGGDMLGVGLSTTAPPRTHCAAPGMIKRPRTKTGTRS